MSPLVSVVTSCFNASKYLPEAIESILAQTFKDFEFILINDGSTDNTAEIIRRYEKADKRIVVIEKANTGLADSLNVGLGLAKGKWIARLDADDVAFKERIEKQVNYIADHRNIVLLGTGCFIIDETGNVMRRKTFSSGNASLLDSLEDGGFPFPHSSVLYRRDAVQRLGGYRKRLNGAEDLDLWLRLNSFGEFACLEAPLIKLRKHLQSMTAGNYKSLTLTYAGIISNKLNKQNHPDPIEQDEFHFQEFLKWVEQRLEQQGRFEELRTYHALDNRRYTRFGIRSTLEFFILLISRPGLLLLWHRIFSSKTTTQLTDEWIKIHEQ